MIDVFGGGRFAGTEPFALRDSGDRHSLTALPGGGFALVAERSTDWPDGSSATGVTIQIFDRHGREVQSEFFAYPKNSTSQTNPTIAGLPSGGFVVTWEMYDFGEHVLSGIVARMFDAEGTPTGEPFLVNTDTSGRQSAPAVATLADGGFAITWSSLGQSGSDDSGLGIRAQVFDAAGNRIGGEIEVNTIALLDQYDSTIAGLPGGGFVVVWTDSGLNPTVRMQTFDSSGAKVGPETNVPSGPAAGEHDAAITVLASGGFVISWSVSGPDGSDVKARLFGANGQKLGGEISLHTAAIGEQHSTSLAALPDGGFIATWRDVTGGGINWFQKGVIQAQIFDANGTKVGAEFTVSDQSDFGHLTPKATVFGSGDVAVVWLDAGSGFPGLRARHLFSADSGTEGADVFSGTADRDFLYGLGGDDHLSGLGEDDLLAGGTGADVLLGGDGADKLSAQDYGFYDQGLEQDQLLGGDGDDELSAGLGDSVDGGSGTDRLHYSLDGMHFGTVFDTSALVSNQPVSIGGGTIQSVEILISLLGTQYDDVLMLADQATMLTVHAGAGDDEISWGTSGFSVDGGDGNDLLIDNGGADFIDGGEGYDTLDYRSATSGVSVALGNPGEIGTGPAGDRIRNVERVNGSNFGDNLGGGSGSDRLFGYLGDDILFGGAGSDFLDGGLGNDFIDGGDGRDAIGYVGASSGVVVNLSRTDRQQTGGGGIDIIANIEVVYGSAFDDIFVGNASLNTLFGGSGNDTYHVHSDDDVVEFDGQGVDRVFASGSFVLPEAVENLILTGPGDTYGIGNAQANVLTGNAGNNSLDGGAGADVMKGGAGDDVYVIDDAGDRVIEFAAGDGVDEIRSSVSQALYEHVENLTLTGAGNTYAMGNSLANVLTGGSGDNLLNGKSGADTMRGGAGNDTYVVDDAGDLVEESGTADGYDRVTSSISYTLTAFVERLDLVGGALNGTGNDLANVLIGNAAANRLDGKGGADEMKGGAGNDTYVVDHSADKAIETSAAHGIDTVEASVGHTLGAHVENLTLTGTAAIDGTGNALANRLLGNEAANVLNGGAGADVMKGFGGNDTYVVDHAGDVVEENSTSGGIDLVMSTIGYTLGANVENLRLLGAGNTDGTGNGLANQIVGNTGANTLRGDAGDDSLSGSAGDDVLHGGLGSDTLHGGGGADDFVFDTALGGANVDTILDMRTGLDTIVLDDAVFAALGLGQLSANAFTAGAAATTADHRIVYDRSSGALFYDADGAGGADAVLFAVIENAPISLSASDFLVI